MNPGKFYDPVAEQWRKKLRLYEQRGWICEAPKCNTEIMLRQIYDPATREVEHHCRRSRLRSFLIWMPLALIAVLVTIALT